jgi:subtilisin-like proprotein convertase family protein
MKPFSFFSLADKLRRRPVKRKLAPGRVPAAHLLLEELENRTLLSVLPAPTVGIPQNLTDPISTNLPNTAVNPQVALDPSNSSVLVEFDTYGPADLQFVTTTPPPNNNIATSYLEGRYSVNGGTTWLTLAPPGSTLGSSHNLLNPLLSAPEGPVPYTTVSAPSVTFDTQNNAYVIFTEYTTSDTAGVVLLSKYNFSGPTPTLVFENHVLYQWAGQDPAYNPVVAIDTNEATFTDPSTHATQTDPLAATITEQGSVVPQAVFVAWNTDQTQPTDSVPATLSYILVEGSDNGGQTFSAQQYVESPGNSSNTSDILRFLSSATINPGFPIGVALGRFYSDARDAGHDIVTVTGDTITAMLVNAFGQVVESTTTDLPSDEFPIGFTAGNFTSSVYTDLAVTYFDESTDEYLLQSYVSGGSGTFSPSGSPILLPGAPSEDAIVTGEFVHGSTFTDIAVGYTSSSAGGVEILLGTGTGTFTVKGSYPTSLNPALASPISLAVGEFDTNNNSFEDLVVANTGTNDVAILTGNGDGSFNAPTTAATISTGAVPLDVAVGSFNGDAFEDVAFVTNTTGKDGQGFVGFGTGNGTFMAPPGGSYATFQVTSGVDLVAVGDFNGDGNDDIATFDSVVAGTTINDSLSITSGNGNGTFNPIVTDPTPLPGPVAIVAGNLNGDTDTDLAVVDAGPTANVTIFAGFSVLSAAQGSAPEIVFTQGTSSGRVPGGELMLIWNGSTIIDISSVFTQVYNSIDTNISLPTGSNPSEPTPAVAALSYVNTEGGEVVDAVGSGDTKIPTLNTYPVTVNITDPQFTTLDDLTVSLNLIYPDIGDLLIQLVAPSSVTALTGISTINLLNNAINAAGTSTKDGLPGVEDLGAISEVGPNGTVYVDTGATVLNAVSDQIAFNIGGTIFEVNAPRSITDLGATGSRIGVFEPEGSGTLAQLISGGVPAADLDGTWTLEITSFATAPVTPVVEDLVDWSLNLTSGISTKGFGTGSTVLSTNPELATGAQPASTNPLIGALNGVFNVVTGTYSTVTTYSGADGIGPGYSAAIDNTLGSNSPYQGRMYIVYTGYDTDPNAPPQNVYLIYSDNNGETWSAPFAFTDDSGESDFSQGDRAKFDPSIAVDPVTGTVVVTYYDGRFDPDNVSVVNAIQTSIDGGESFSSANFLNELNTADDFLTETSEIIEPVPGDPGAAQTGLSGPNSGGLGFGDRPGSLVVYDGVVTALFTSNLNSGPDRYGSGSPYTFTTGAGIFSTTANFDDGPRVVSGDEGPITEDETMPVSGASYDNVFAPDGTRELTGFVITFDRPVIAADIDSSTVTVMYQSPAGGAAVPVAVGTVTALDEGSTAGLPGLSADNPLATTFYIGLLVPASAVGSYSYSVGPAVFDDILSEESDSDTIQFGTEMDQNGDPTPGQPQDDFSMPDPINGTPFIAPFVAGSEPLVIPGPHVIYTYTASSTPPTAAQVDAIEDGTMEQTDNVVVDGSVDSLTILFDRNMNPSTFDYNANTPGETDPIISIMGPNGPIAGPFTITSDPAGTASALAARTFLVSFPQQVLSGTYTITFAPTAEDTHGDEVDSNLNAGVYLVEGTDPTSTATTISTYTTNTPVTIVPGKTVLSTINITDNYVITQIVASGQTPGKNISVQLNINYPNDPDLEAELISPTGTVIPLFTNVGTFGEPPLSNFENTTFEDSASTPIQLGSVPFDVGPFDPQEPLSVLIGEGSEGKWTLAITDTNASATASPSDLLTYWTLNLPHTTPSSGLGESVADQFTANFRIFTQSPTNPVSSDSYTAIGPASENGLLFDATTGKYDIVSPNAVSGEVSAIAVDPSDPSGNTVYVGGGTGGIWKTTDFLTTNPNGPTWIPLANLGPTNSMNISGLAIFGVNDNPSQSIIYAITGNSNLFSADGYPSNPSAFNDVEGVGLLCSTNGGETWEVLTGLNNVSSSGTILPIESTSRDNTFLGQVGFQVAVDPTRLPDGQIAVYAAFSGGLYRSITSGNTWQLVMAGDCTSVVLAPGSTDANGNEEILYAGFQSAAGGSGVYMTTSALTTTSLTLMAGGEGVNNRVQNGLTGGLDVPIPVENDSLSPNGHAGRIVVVTPNLTGSPLQNIFYQGWVYAAAITSSGTLAGLYMTKDFGNNWTLIDLPADVVDGFTFPSNNTKLTSFDPTSHATADEQGAYDISLAIDPANPNVVYLGGTILSGTEYANQLIRIDTTNVLDVYAEVGYLNSSTTGNLQYGASGLAASGDAIGSVSVTDPDSAIGYGLTNAETFALESVNGSTNYLDLYRDPENPFELPSTLQFQNITQFNNQGTGAQWEPFTYFLDNSTNIHAIVTETDPLTGEIRVIVGDDDGIFSGVDNGDSLSTSDEDGITLNDQDNQAPTEGFAAVVTGTRNGNLQLAQLAAGTAQPSTLAASITNALYYAAASGGTAGTLQALSGSDSSLTPTIVGGAAQSEANILTTGDITWQGIPSALSDIATDQTGGGTVYQFDVPENTYNQFPFLPTDFFLVTPVAPSEPGEPPQPPSPTTSRTTGLLLTGDNPAQDVGEWLLDEGFNFTVNPVDPTALVVSSSTGNIFRTEGSSTGQGVEWFEIATGSQLVKLPGHLGSGSKGSNADALEFGAPQSQNDLDNFIYAGTEDGNIYVTTNGGGSWTNISAGLDGSAVEQIVADPRDGSTDAYAVTLDGVYYMANSTATNAKWVKLDDTTGQGALFTLTRGNFDNTSDPMPTLQYLTSLAVDWRYAIPDNPADPTGPTHPVLYVAGNGGVFRSLNQGQTWTYYPDVTLDGAVTEEGNLPNVHVTGLTLVLGDIDPETGFPNTSSGLNQLVVTTFGSGEYAIRLDSTVMVDGKPLNDFLDSPNGGPSVTSATEIPPAPGTVALTGFEVTFSGPIDPTTFTAAEVDTLLGPGGVSLAPATVVNVTPTPPPGVGSLDNEYDILFATPQTATGTYELAIGPGITDDSGNPMAAVFSQSFFFTPDTPPTFTPTTFNVPPIPPGTSYEVNFSVASATYAASQLTVTAGSNNSALLGTLSLTHNGANYTLTISPPALNSNNQPNTGSATITLTAEDPQTIEGSVAFPVIVDQSPVLAPTGSLSQLPSAFPYAYTIGATSPEGLPLTYTATTRGDSLLFDLQQQYQFQGVGYFTAGAAAYVLHSNQPGPGVSGYYLIRPSDGAVFPYDGSGSYAHSFANETALATLGSNVFTDPTLLFNAQPPANYSGSISSGGLYAIEQMYQFRGLGYYTFGASAYVLQASTNNSFGNPYYLLRSDGSLFAYDGSGSYSHTYANTTPVAILGPEIYSYPNELVNANAAPALYTQLNQLNQQYDLQELNGSFYTNTYGHEAQWIYSPVLNQYGQHWYTLTLQTISNVQEAVLTAWEGYQDSEVGAVIATLAPSVYSNPFLLTNATYLPDPAVTTSINQTTGVLTIGLPSSTYLGTFVVTITATDGLIPVTQVLTVTSTDTAPTVTVLQGSTNVLSGSTQSLTHGALAGGVNFTVTPSGGENGSAGDTLQATIEAYSAPFALQQQYQFQGLGYYAAGASAYVLTAVGDNSFGNPYYLLSPTGGVYAYDGSGSYAHTYANVTPLATLGSNFFGDPTLLLNAQPAVDYSTLYNLQQQYQFQGIGYFTAGATAYVLQASSNNSFSNPYYLLTANGNLYPYDGSGSYAHTIANVAPLTTTPLNPGVYVNPSLLLNAQAAPTMYPQLLQDEQQYDLQEYQGSFYTGLRGNAAKWLYSPILNVNGTNWYTLVLSANGTQALLYAWNGGSDSIPNGAEPVATLDPTVYFNPALLLNAKAPLAESSATESITGNTLTLTIPDGFVGTSLIEVTASDGVLTTNPPLTFQLVSTDTPPVPNTIPNQTASQSGSPLHVTLSATDAENDPITYTATAVGYSPAYNLQQIYQFKGVGYYTDSSGAAAYVMTSSVLGGSGGYYLVDPATGDVYAYDGSGSYAHTFANSANLIANLSPDIYTMPTLLTNAQPPAASGALVSVSGNTLTINVGSVSPGTVFQVIVAANDGAETTRTSFLVTVTA